MDCSDILDNLYDPNEIDNEEYRAIFDKLSHDLRALEPDVEPLDAAICVCDEFMSWAESVKELLLALKLEEQIVPRLR